MNNNRIVWGVIVVILIVAALAYFGTTGNRTMAVFSFAPTAVIALQSKLSILRKFSHR